MTREVGACQEMVDVTASAIMMTDSYLTTATMMIDPLDFEKKICFVFFFVFFLYYVTSELDALMEPYKEKELHIKYFL